VTQNPEGQITVSAVRRGGPLFVRFDRELLQTLLPGKRTLGELAAITYRGASPDERTRLVTVSIATGVALAWHPDVGWACLGGAGHSDAAAEASGRGSAEDQDGV
jgi:hypothetical protein